jgi:hypothetical protein
LTDDEDPDMSPKAIAQRKLCLCAVTKPKETQEEAQPMSITTAQLLSNPNFPCKKTSITDEYRISHEVDLLSVYLL